MARRRARREGRRTPKETGERAAGGRPHWVDKVGLLIAAASVTVAIVALDGDSGSDSTSSGAAPARLEVVDARVRNVSLERDSHGRLEILLHNTGGRLTVIHGARIEIRRVRAVPRCATQGDLVLTNVYGVSLPRNARPGHIVRVPLHQQVGPDEADRFGVDLTTKRPEDETVVYLFDLEVTLSSDDPERILPVGRVVVSLPEMPDEGQYYWVEDTGPALRRWAAAEPAAMQLWREAMPCWESNTAALRAALRGPAIRSPELSALEGRLATPSVRALE